MSSAKTIAPTSYIIDASFVLQALLGQHDSVSQRFLQLFSETSATRIIAPDLLKLEVRNGLRFSVPTSELIRETLSAFSHLPIEFITPQDFLLDQAVIISLQYKTTVYDSLYHALALDQAATFITCDQKYYQAAKTVGSIELVE